MDQELSLVADVIVSLDLVEDSSSSSATSSPYVASVA